jgi:hypothetical protein
MAPRIRTRPVERNGTARPRPAEPVPASIKDELFPLPVGITDRDLAESPVIARELLEASRLTVQGLSGSFEWRAEQLGGGRDREVLAELRDLARVFDSAVRAADELRRRIRRARKRRAGS